MLEGLPLRTACSWFQLVATFYYDDDNKENEKKEAKDTDGKEEKCIQGLVRKPKEETAGET